jgi:hypothetical protein
MSWRFESSRRYQLGVSSTTSETRERPQARITAGFFMPEALQAVSPGSRESDGICVGWQLSAAANAACSGLLRSNWSRRQRSRRRRRASDDAGLVGTDWWVLVSTRDQPSSAKNPNHRLAGLLLVKGGKSFEALCRGWWQAGGALQERRTGQPVGGLQDPAAAIDRLVHYSTKAAGATKPHASKRSNATTTRRSASVNHRATTTITPCSRIHAQNSNIYPQTTGQDDCRFTGHAD